MGLFGHFYLYSHFKDATVFFSKVQLVSIVREGNFTPLHSSSLKWLLKENHIFSACILTHTRDLLESVSIINRDLKQSNFYVKLMK